MISALVQDNDDDEEDDGDDDDNDDGDDDEGGDDEGDDEGGDDDGDDDTDDDDDDDDDDEEEEEGLLHSATGKPKVIVHNTNMDQSLGQGCESMQTACRDYSLRLCCLGQFCVEEVSGA